MPIVFAAMMPHGEELLPIFGEHPEMAPLRAAMRRLGEAMRAARPELLVLASPHHLRVQGQLAIADSTYLEGRLEGPEGSYTRRLRVDRAFAGEIAAASEAAGLPAARIGYQTASGEQAQLPLDFGSLVPLYYLLGAEADLPLCLCGPPCDRGLQVLARVGAEIARRTGERRIAFVASADLAHAHRAEGPYGYDPAAARYDALVQEAALAGDLSTLPGDPDLIEAAKPDAPWQLALLAGVLGGPHAPYVSAYALCGYFGMLAAGFAI